MHSFYFSPRRRFVFQTEISGKYIVLVLISLHNCFISFPLFAVGISLPFFVQYLLILTDPGLQRSGTLLHWLVVVVLPIGNLSKPRRRRQRERHQTKGLMSRTIAVHVRYKALYISLASSAKQQREMTKFCVVYGSRTTTANFWYFHLELNAIGVLNRSRQSRISLVKYKFIFQ